MLVDIMNDGYSLAQCICMHIWSWHAFTVVGHGSRPLARRYIWPALILF